MEIQKLTDLNQLTNDEVLADVVEKFSLMIETSKKMILQCGATMSSENIDYVESLIRSCEYVLLLAKRTQANPSDKNRWQLKSVYESMKLVERVANMEAYAKRDGDTDLPKQTRH
jgi:hypothetical protein